MDKVSIILKNNDGSWTYNKNFILQFPLKYMSYSTYQLEPRKYLSEHIGKNVICIFYGSRDKGTVDAQFLVTGKTENKSENNDDARDREIKEELSENYKDLVYDFNADHTIIKTNYNQNKVGAYLIVKDGITIDDFVRKLGNCLGKEDNGIFAIGISHVTKYLIKQLENALFISSVITKMIKKQRLNFHELAEYNKSKKLSCDLYDAINNCLSPLCISINQIIQQQKNKENKLKHLIREPKMNLNFVKLKQVILLKSEEKLNNQFE